MSNAIENARKALEETELAGSDIAKYHALKAAVDALRELLDSRDAIWIDGYDAGHADGFVGTRTAYNRKFTHEHHL